MWKKIDMIKNGENIVGKTVRSAVYNMNFNYTTGYTERWGNTIENNPVLCPFGPEIADIEISTICNGPYGTPCDVCYKTNTGEGINMSFEDFKKIFDKLPKTLTQIAFGIGDIKANPDLWKIMDYCRSNDHNYVIPNITINGNVDDNDLDNLAQRCGAVAVSHYGDNLCFDAVKGLTDRGMKQINIHKVLAEETFDSCLELLEKFKRAKLQEEGHDPRLTGLNAIVFLLLKPKGKRHTMQPVKSVAKFQKIMNYLYEYKIPVGFDSCSSYTTMRSIKETDKLTDEQKTYCCQCMDSCESSLFSIYINSEGIIYPCSFSEGVDGYPGIDLLDESITFDNFIDKVWDSDIINNFRHKLLDNVEDTDMRKCPIYDLYEEENKEKEAE